MLSKIIRFFNLYWSNFTWWFIDLFWKTKPSPISKKISNTTYSIGVVTYVNRYEIHFLPLIKRLVTLFPDTQIIVAINGYYDAPTQKRYLHKITSLLSQYQNVNYITYDIGQSLSKLWNQLIIHSKTTKTFIFNDDIKINSNFRLYLEKSGILTQKCALINASWSHFLISKEIIELNGWFDERFLGVGYEDQDYEIRLTLKNWIIKDYKIKGIKNLVFMTTDFSYGENIEIDYKKYSGVNGHFFSKKWLISNQEKPNFTWVRIIQNYAQPIKNMETPNFYPNFIFDK